MSDREPPQERNWHLLSFYEKFEELVAIALTSIIAVIILAALFNLAYNVVIILMEGLVNPADKSVFQAIFGMIMTLLIALEFKHSILKVVARRESIIQVKTVILIALMAVARKFIILDIGQTSAGTIAALAAAILALGAAYWLVRLRDDLATD